MRAVPRPPDDGRRDRLLLPARTYRMRENGMTDIEEIYAGLEPFATDDDVKDARWGISRSSRPRCSLLRATRLPRPSPPTGPGNAHPKRRPRTGSADEVGGAIEAAGCGEPGGLFASRWPYEPLANERTDEKLRSGHRRWLVPMRNAQDHEDHDYDAEREKPPHNPFPHPERSVLPGHVRSPSTLGDSPRYRSVSGEEDRHVDAGRTGPARPTHPGSPLGRGPSGWEAGSGTTPRPSAIRGPPCAPGGRNVPGAFVDHGHLHARLARAAACRRASSSRNARG